MIRAPEPINFLIVSKEPIFQELVRFTLEYQLLCEVSVCQSEKVALEYLKKIQVFPHIIIYDYEPGAYLVEDFVGYLKQSQKPVHILVSAKKIVAPADRYFKDEEFIHLLEKDHILQNILAFAMSTYAEIQGTPTSEYCRISLKCLEALEGVSKDLFIQLGKEKFVKLFNKDAELTLEDLNKYREKGLQYFYLERLTCNWVVDQIKKQFPLYVRSKSYKFILRSPDESPEKRFEQKIIRIEEELHIDEEFKKEIELVMSKVLAHVQKDIKFSKIAGMIHNRDPQVSYFSKRLQMMSYLTCYLAKSLEWNSKATIEKLVYASVLHDITIAFKPHLLKLRDLEDFEANKKNISEEDQKLFLNHPRESGAIVKSSFKFSPPETDILILLHHELPNGKGFPAGLNSDKISPLSSLFILCNDFTHLVMNEDYLDLEGIILKLETRFDYPTFRRLVAMLKKFQNQAKA